MHIEELINRLKELQRLWPNIFVFIKGKKIIDVNVENNKIIIEYE